MQRLDNYPPLAILVWITGIHLLIQGAASLPAICLNTCTCTDLTNVICHAAGYTGQAFYLNRIGLTNVPTFMGVFSTVQVIDLSNNGIINIGNGAFASTNFPYVHTILLRSNSIKLIDTRAFILSSLTTLDLSNNSIAVLPYNQFSAMFTAQLQILILHRNIISTIDTQAFNLPSLQMLDLSLNSIQEFDFNVLSAIGPSISSLNISFNALNQIYQDTRIVSRANFPVLNVILLGTSITCATVTPLCLFINNSDNFTCNLQSGAGRASVAAICSTANSSTQAYSSLYLILPSIIATGGPLNSASLSPTPPPNALTANLQWLLITATTVTVGVISLISVLVISISVGLFLWRRTPGTEENNCNTCSRTNERDSITKSVLLSPFQPADNPPAFFLFARLLQTKAEKLYMRKCRGVKLM
ncbi:hypothetical protein EMCRGX_G020952 [Ephydatia muelleri]